MHNRIISNLQWAHYTFNAAFCIHRTLWMQANTMNARQATYVTEALGSPKMLTGTWQKSNVLQSIWNCFTSAHAGSQSRENSVVNVSILYYFYIFSLLHSKTLICERITPIFEHRGTNKYHHHREFKFKLRKKVLNTVFKLFTNPLKVYD